MGGTIKIDYVRMEKLYNKGLSDLEISLTMGCNVKTVRDWRKRQDLPSMAEIRTARLNSSFEDMYAKGMTDGQIAAALHLTEAAVRYYRHKQQARKHREADMNRVFHVYCQDCGAEFMALSPRALYCDRCKRERKYESAKKKKSAQRGTYSRRAKESLNAIAKREAKARKKKMSYGMSTLQKVTVKVPKSVQKQERTDPAVREKEYLAYLLRM